MQSRTWALWLRRLLGWFFSVDLDMCLDLDQCFESKKMEVRIFVVIYPLQLRIEE